MLRGRTLHMPGQGAQTMLWASLQASAVIFSSWNARCDRPQSTSNGRAIADFRRATLRYSHIACLQLAPAGTFASAQ